MLELNTLPLSRALFAKLSVEQLKSVMDVLETSAGKKLFELELAWLQLYRARKAGNFVDHKN